MLPIVFKDWLHSEPLNKLRLNRKPLRLRLPKRRTPTKQVAGSAW
jgi:hypothetical protein